MLSDPVWSKNESLFINDVTQRRADLSLENRNKTKKQKQDRAEWTSPPPERIYDVWERVYVHAHSHACMYVCLMAVCVCMYVYEWV